jgi:hypothetical protein
MITSTPTTPITTIDEYIYETILIPVIIPIPKITISPNMTTTSATEQTPCQIEPPGAYILYSERNSGKCLKVNGSINDNDMELELWDCSVDNNLQFTYNPYTKEIRVKGSCKCADIKNDSLKDGAIIYLSYCDSSSNTQKWIYDNGLLRNIASYKCINFSGSSSENGARIILFDCRIYPNLLWNIV